MFSQNAQRVLEKRYLRRNGDGELIETPQDLMRRVAHAIGQAESSWNESEISSLEEDYYELMVNGKFLPNSPTLMNAGRDDGQLSACFVLPVPDNLEGIFETCKHAALIHKTGGGTGFSFSQLRPKEDPVASSIGVASGPVSFMGVYDAATEAIRQGGTRRGANMGILRIDHPDIESFITCKKDTNKLNNFNISIAVTDKFMNALADDADFELIHPRTNQPVKSVSAKKLFEQIVENAHETGEPGIVFIDRINNLDPVHKNIEEDGEVKAGTEVIEATNPCGEQPLGPYDACNLGSINVSKFIDQDSNSFDWDALEKAIKLAVRFLDGVIEVNNYPLEFIARATLNNRRIGLGLMGWAEALILLDTAYNSNEALNLAEKLMKFIQKVSHQASRDLASERGVFPNWKYSKWHEEKTPMRNATVTTIAPTGTISIIAGTSSGIEPLFALSYVRRVMGGEELIEINPLFEQISKEKGFYSEELMQKVHQEGTLENIDSVPDEVKKIFVCSHQIDYEWHVKMQAAFQKHTDNAVSKTINFPKEANVDQIKASYLMAWELGLKGITVYRDTSRSSQVLNINKTDPLKSTGKNFNNEEIPRKKSWNKPTVQTARKAASCEGGAGYIDKRHTKPESKLVAHGSSVKSSHQRGFRDDRSFHKSTPCPECGVSIGSMMKYEACLLCVSCGYTKC